MDYSYRTGRGPVEILEFGAFHDDCILQHRLQQFQLAGDHTPLLLHNLSSLGTHMPDLVYH